MISWKNLIDQHIEDIWIQLFMFPLVIFMSVSLIYSIIIWEMLGLYSTYWVRFNVTFLTKLTNQNKEQLNSEVHVFFDAFLTQEVSLIQ